MINSIVEVEVYCVNSFFCEIFVWVCDIYLIFICWVIILIELYFDGG